MYSPRKNSPVSWKLYTRTQNPLASGCSHIHGAPTQNPWRTPRRMSEANFALLIQIMFPSLKQATCSWKLTGVLPTHFNKPHFFFFTNYQNIQLLNEILFRNISPSRKSQDVHKRNPPARGIWTEFLAPDCSSAQLPPRSQLQSNREW